MPRCAAVCKTSEFFKNSEVCWRLSLRRVNDFERLDPLEILFVVRGKCQPVMQGACRNQRVAKRHGVSLP